MAPAASITARLRCTSRTSFQLGTGTGALGDMGAHLIDHPYWALDLTYPTSVEATSTPWGGDEEDVATYPQSMLVHYDFPARGGV